MGDQRVELIVTRGGASVHERSQHPVDLVWAERIGLDPRFGPVVRSVDAHDLEVRRDRGDLTGEVIRREPTLPESIGQRVRRGNDPHSLRDDRAEEGDGHQRLGDVIELELVDAEQPVRRERGDRLVHAEEADDAGQLGERQVRLGIGCFVPRRREQVGLAHAVAAVEVARRSSRQRRPPAFRHRFAARRFSDRAVNRSISARAAA